MRAKQKPEAHVDSFSSATMLRTAVDSYTIRAMLLSLAFTLLASTAQAQTTYAWNGAVNNQWSTAENWTPIGVPTDGDSLVFPSGASNLSNSNNLPVGTSFVQITLSGGNYALGGNGIALTSTLRQEAGTSGNTVNLPIDVGTNAVTLVAGGTNNSYLRLTGALSGSGPITISGAAPCGRLALSGTHPYSGTLTIANTNCPDVSLNGASLPSATLVHAGRLLGGHGTIGPLMWNDALHLLVGGNNVNSPGDTTTGQLSTGNLSMNGFGIAYMDIKGTTPGAGHDQINVTGTVTLSTSKTLDLKIDNSFLPTVGQQFVLINNDGSDPVTGSFNGRPEGSVTTLNGADFHLSYAGGSGNDVVLTCTFSPRAWNGSVSNLWSNPANWTPTGVPAQGDSLLFPLGAARPNNTNDLPAGIGFSRLVISGNSYALGGNGIGLISSLRAESGAFTGSNTLNLPIHVGDNVVTLAANSSLHLAGPLSGTGPITISGAAPCGRLAVSGSHTYGGTLTIGATNCPQLVLRGASLPSATLVHTSSGLLGGNGTLGPLLWNSSGPIVIGGNFVDSTGDPTTGQLNTGNLNFSGSGTAYMNINGTMPAASHDQINVAGTVTLGTQKTLDLTLGSSFVPAIGQQFVLINNDGADPILGTFSGRAEGSTVSLGGFNFSFSYAGGTGNDVTLTSLNGRTTSSAALASSLNPAYVGQQVTFSATVGGSGATPTGTVTFFDGMAALGSGSLNGGGVATYTTSALGAGSHSIRAEFAGDANYGGSASNVVTQTVIPNEPPTIAVVGDRSVLEDSGTAQVTINVSDLESAASSLVVTAVSNNTGLIPHPPVAAGMSDGERVVSFTPVAQQHGGPVTITLTITDPIGASAQRTFTVTVTAVNDAPVLTLGSVTTHAAATTGVQSQPGFASVDFGPADEDASQAVDDYLVDDVSDPDGVLVPASVDIGNDGTLTYALSGVGGTATISVRVRDNGGVDNGGVDTSTTQQFTIGVTPGADLQIAKTNHRSGLLDGESTVYAIVVANAGPNAVTATSVSDPLPANLINASWMCVQAFSTATCPSPDTGSGDLAANIDLGVNQYLRFDVMAEVDGSVGAFVTNTASTAPPVGTTALDTSNDSATDQDPIVPIGILTDGFESAGQGFTVNGASEALR